MEEILIPLMFFASLVAFPLLRRQMIHRHRLELAAIAAPEAAPAATPDDASTLALRLPEPYRLRALALLCRLEDLSGAALETRAQYVVRRARHEDLRATLRAYLDLGEADRAALHARGQDPEAELGAQLAAIQAAVEGALAAQPSAADRLLTQGRFLGATPEVLELDVLEKVRR